MARTVRYRLRHGLRLFRAARFAAFLAGGVFFFLRADDDLRRAICLFGIGHPACVGVRDRLCKGFGVELLFDVELKGTLAPVLINNTIKKCMDNESISGTDDPVVSSDIIGIPFGSFVDFQCTKVLSCSEDTTMAQIVSWYDNEASYTHQYVKTLLYWISLIK